MIQLRFFALGIINTDLNGTRIQSLVEKAKQGPTLDGIPTIVVRVIDSCDDVEILNATSKKAGIHKTTGIYFSIPNLGPAESIKELYPLIICSAIDYKKYGPAKVFECFFEDLQNLNDKINVKEIHGKKFNLKIIRVGDTGDALGLNDWHGYRGTSSNSFCRTCLIQRKDFVENLNAEAKFRTIEDYCEIREKIQNAKTEKEKDEICKDWGLKTDVHLHQEPFFYTLGPDVHPFYQEIFDTMHDLLEGCSKLIANQIISFIIKNTQLSLIDINNRIKNFNYGPLSFKDKPLPITEAALTKGRDVGQSAVQSWVLIRILPFLIDDIKVKTKGKNDDKMNEKQISEKLENIKNLIGIHLDVLSIVLSKAMMQQNVDKLKSLIYEHNSLFQKLFPSAAKLNKFHHLLHYRNSILKNGPLAFWWTARFEAFHQYLKRISNSCRNYINLPKTLADRLSYTLSYNLSYPDEAVESQSGEDLTSIKLDKIWYNKNSLLCYSKPDELPLFGSIKKISYNQEAKEAKLTLKKFKTVGWNYNKHSYQVEREEGEVLVNPRNLAFKYPLDLWSLCDSRTEEKLFVSLKYLLISDIQ